MGTDGILKTAASVFSVSSVKLGITYFGSSFLLLKKRFSRPLFVTDFFSSTFDSTLASIFSLTRSPFILTKSFWQVRRSNFELENEVMDRTSKTSLRLGASSRPNSSNSSGFSSSCSFGFDFAFVRFLSFSGAGSAFIKSSQLCSALFTGNSPKSSSDSSSDLGVEPNAVHGVGNSKTKQKKNSLQPRY